jgi:chromosome segregation ATPase
LPNKAIDIQHALVKDLKAQIEKAKETISAYAEELQRTQLTDTAELTEQITNVEETNKQVRENAKYTEHEQAYDKEKAEYDALSDKIEQLENEKDEALQKATMPIDGLSVDEDGVTYDDGEHGVTPIGQVNTAKRIEIGTAIHMAMNPQLKVMFVEANAFDEETEAAIEAAVKDKDYQLFEEVVDDESETGIHLVDGTVKE